MRRAPVKKREDDLKAKKVVSKSDDKDGRKLSDKTSQRK